MSTVLLALTGVSLAIALFASVIAWRVVGEERRRSEARVLGLAAAIGGEADGGLEPGVAPPIRFRVGAAAGIFGAVAAALVLAVSALSGDRVAPPALASSALPAETRQAEPLELVALTHDRSRTQLTVRGIVRNPLRGETRRDIEAVVHIYDDRGELVASGRAPVTPTLSPGEESTFVVAMPEAVRIERYRLSFSELDGVVPHVDHRAGV